VSKTNTEPKETKVMKHFALVLALAFAGTFATSAHASGTPSADSTNGWQNALKEAISELETIKARVSLTSRDGLLADGDIPDFWSSITSEMESIWVALPESDVLSDVEELVAMNRTLQDRYLPMPGARSAEELGHSRPEDVDLLISAGCRAALLAADVAVLAATAACASGNVPICILAVAAAFAAIAAAEASCAAEMER
jgi:hypothetical protein